MTILFFVFWMVLNGRITLEIVLFGIGISGIIFAFVCKFMGYSVKKDIHALSLIPRGAIYLTILSIEIIKANIAVLKIILSRGHKYKPVIVHFKTDLKTNVARAVLANSITMTPGTITVSMEDGEYYVHCLDKSMAEGISESVFVRQLRKFEK